jgi:hypothetical protein
MAQPETESQTLVDALGTIDVGGRLATVTWPRLGDAVGIDFTGSTVRFGVVLALDTDPRLRVEPEHADLLDLEGRLFVLEQVGALWYGALLRSEANGLRREAA